ncbi:S-adenosylmethionine:tRNA ribosyltransferase-isomerase [Candidatus Karelsulcia muelleri]
MKKHTTKREKRLAPISIDTKTELIDHTRPQGDVRRQQLRSTKRTSPHQTRTTRSKKLDNKRTYQHKDKNSRTNNKGIKVWGGKAGKPKVTKQEPHHSSEKNNYDYDEEKDDNISKYILINFKTSWFNVQIPNQLIPNQPRIDKNPTRLMVLNRRNRTIQHQYIKDLKSYFVPGDTIVLNNTKMYPSILYGKKEKNGSDIQVYLLREINPNEKSWEVLVQPARKIRIGNRLFFLDENNDKLIAVVHDNTISKGRIIKFHCDLPYNCFKQKLTNLCKIQGKRQDVLSTTFKKPFIDYSNMQTSYAKTEGSTSPHFPGLHLSKYILKQLEFYGINISYVTLHLGHETYEQIMVEDIQKHKMKEEYFQITHQACRVINSSLKSQQKVCAIGTSTLRALESSVSPSNTLIPNNKWTNKFIYPYYNFKIANALLTHFHPPQSTLMPLLAAFLGYDFLKYAYEMAIQKKYKFYQFGDAMLII